MSTLQATDVVYMQTNRSTTKLQILVSSTVSLCIGPAMDLLIGAMKGPLELTWFTLYAKYRVSLLTTQENANFGRSMIEYDLVIALLGR